MRDQIRRAFATSIAVKRAFLARNADALVTAIETLAAAIERGNKVLLFGNGGSAADAQHIAAELVGRYNANRPPLAAIALTTDSSAMTSIANDFGYDNIFVRQLEALANPGDVALAISTSGNSTNVLRAVRACRKLGVTSIALTGGSGGRLLRAADIALCVGSTKDTARIQETHILIGHVICEQLDRLHLEKARR